MTQQITIPLALLEQLVGALSNADDALMNCQSLLAALNRKGFAETCQRANVIASEIITKALTAGRAAIDGAQRNTGIKFRHGCTTCGKQTCGGH